MMPPYSCSTPGRNPGTSTKVSKGTLNALQNRMKRDILSDASMSIAPASTRLVGDNSHGTALQAPEADYYIRGETRLNLEEILVIEYSCEYRPDIVADLGFRRHYVVQLRIDFQFIGASQARRIFQIVRRQETQQAPAQRQRTIVVLGNEVNHARTITFAPRARPIAAVTLSPVTCLITCGGDEHLRAPGLDDEIGQRRAVGCTARTRTR